MSALEALLKHIHENEDFKRFRMLEKRILSHPDYQRKYADLLTKQKTLVRQQHRTNSNKNAAEVDYHQALEPLLDDPLITEYLHLQSYINDTLQMICQLIEVALEKPFNP